MNMAIGPVQLLVLGFSQPKFHGEIIAELERLRESDLVRVIDSLAVYKDADGELEVEHLSNLSKDEAIELGSKIGALIGLGFEGEEGAEAGALAGGGGGGGGGGGEREEGRGGREGGGGGGGGRGGEGGGGARPRRRGQAGGRGERGGRRSVAGAFRGRLSPGRGVSTRGRGGGRPQWAGGRCSLL